MSINPGCPYCTPRLSPPVIGGRLFRRQQGQVFVLLRYGASAKRVKQGPHVHCDCGVSEVHRHPNYNEGQWE
jgi:hypothetical protein